MVQDRRGAVEQAGTRPRRRPWTLGFEDPALEARFRERDDEAIRQRTLIGGVIAFVLYGAFGFLDPAVTTSGSAVVPRVVGTLFILAATVALRLRLVRQDVLIAAAMLGALGCLDAMPFVAAVPLIYVTGGHMLTFISLFGLLGARVSLTVPLVAGIAALYLAPLLFEATDLEDGLLNAVFFTGAAGPALVGAFLTERLRRDQFVAEIELSEERARSDRLLHNVLPEAIADRLRRDPRAIAEGSDGVSVVFADVVGFTPVAASLAPRELVDLLDGLFSEFDAVCRAHGVEKIKTIGDAYMAVAGVPRPDADHAGSAAEVALDWMEVARRFDRWPSQLRLRTGISSGPVVAGVIGRDKFAYDLWGDTVNTASRMESHGLPGEVVVSAATRELLGERYAFEGPRQMEVKGKGVLTTYVLRRRGS